ncbi:MAG: aromatic ring-hydroxylating dioxygenase subunit alpha [Methylacidiphilales bacterium]|nr:aromatic ring-hydroxylating dioxygenase subunit alpha [Candidatus Methylacidiphilales bacterium]
MAMNNFLKNDWHVVAQSQDLQPGKIFKARLLGEDIVLWRSGDKALAWQDRCPHRGSSLAKGWIEEDTLVCPYHGFAFDNSGHCVHVPAQPDRPPSKRSRACVQEFHIQERYGFVWVCLGTPQKDVVPFPEWDEPNYHKFCFGPNRYLSSAPRALENFIDVNHIPYVHKGTLGQPEQAAMGDYKVEVTEDGIKVSEVNVWQVDPGLSEQSGKADSAGLQILRPLTVCLRRGADDSRLTIFFTITPIDEEECVAWRWMFLSDTQEVNKPDFNGFVNTIISEDIVAVESQRPKRLPLDLQAEFHLSTIAPPFAYRKWLKKLGVTFGTIY